MEKMPLMSLFQPLTADTFVYPSTVSTGLKKGDRSCWHPEGCLQIYLMKDDRGQREHYPRKSRTPVLTSKVAPELLALQIPTPRIWHQRPMRNTERFGPLWKV